jgi:hypothetical protein
MSQHTDIHIHELEVVAWQDYQSSGYSQLDLPVPGDNYGGITLYFHGASAQAITNLFATVKPNNAALVANLRSLLAVHQDHLHFAGVLRDAIEALS